MAIARDGRAAARGLIPEDLDHFRWIEDVALSPDGRCLAYTVRRPLPGLGGYASSVYMVDVDGGGLMRLDPEGHGVASSLSWSRDGARLAFVWHVGEEITVQVRPRDSATGLAMPLPDVPWGLDWHPDGRRLACVRWVREVDPDQGAAGPVRGAAPTLRVIRRLRYKRDGIGFVHDRYAHIGVLDLGTGHWAQLTDGTCDYDEPRWSWGGDRLACVAMAREQNTELGQGQIFIWDGATGRAQPLLPGWVGACRSPQWGSGDEALAFAGHAAPAPTDRRIFYHVWLHNLVSGETRDLTASLDQMVGNYAFGDQRRILTNITIRWPAGSPRVYFLVTEEGATHLYRLLVDGGPPERLVGGSCVVFAYSPADDGRVAFARSDPASPGEVYLWEQGQVRCLTDVNPWLRSRRLSPPQEYCYPGVDGVPVHAWVIPPLDVEAGRCYPTIVYVHCSMFSWDFSLEFQCYAAAGFAVAYFNQRGTTAGYGQAWTLATEGHQGDRDVEEILRGVDDLARWPFVDGSRLGIAGGSCGGFLTTWIIGHTDRFQAAVTQRSISNYLSFFGTSDIGPEGAYRETGALPWEDPERVWRQSPLAYVDRIRTPLLIVHSDEDHRCAIEQAEQLFKALRWLGRDVELVWFRGEGHGLALGGRPVNRIARLRRILGWFQRYLASRTGRGVTLSHAAPQAIELSGTPTPAADGGRQAEGA